MKWKTEFSECRTYRYSLWRDFGETSNRQYVMFIGLNPSIADENKDDPTIRRCIAFAKSWGYGGLCMTNLFAYCDPKPKNMLAVADPVGPKNDAYLLKMARRAGVIVAAWGTNGTHLNRDLAVRALLPDLHCLHTTKHGHPGHPLYLRAELKPKRF